MIRPIARPGRCPGWLRFCQSSGPYVFKKISFTHHPCLGTQADFSYAQLRRQKQHRGRGRRKTQTASAAAGLSAATELDRSAFRSQFRVSSGSVRCTPETRPSFYVNARKNLFYCHGCGQGGDLIRFVQLSRHLSFRQSLAYLEQQTTATDDSAAAVLQQTAAFYQQQLDHYPEAMQLSRPARTARSHPDQRTADRLRPRRVLTPPPHSSRLFLRSSTAARPAQRAGFRCFLSAHCLPIAPGRTHRQPLRPQYRQRLRSSLPPRLQGWLVCLGAGTAMLRGDSGRGTVRLCRVVAGRVS